MCSAKEWIFQGCHGKGLGIVPLIVATLCTGCLTTPPIDEGTAPPLTALVSGEAVVLVPMDEPHPVVLLLTALTFGADGVPIYSTADVRVIPGDAFFDGDVSSTVRSASYTFPEVEPGTYVLYGFIDVDENFNPLISDLAVMTDADIGGAYLDPETGEPAVFSLERGAVMAEATVVFSSST